jgi:two-component system, sensor histidine kinase and response regulator
MVVDDTLENLRLLASMLGERGYEVRPVTNGRQALLAVELDPPDLIMLDINMPDMNGYELCARLKEHAERRDIPVIFLTAMIDTADKVKAFDAGGVDYITKPFQVEEVLARVKTHVALRRAQVELSQSYARLRDLERMRDDLVNMVVHDMRSPLTCLVMGLELLQEEATRTLGGPSNRLRACAKAADTVNRMANDVLDMSRLEAGRLPINRRASDLVRIAEDVRAAVASLDVERVVSVDAARPVELTCDPDIIRRVLENMVTNGIKHTPRGSRLRISVASEGERVRVAVQDEGPGVPPAARERIFEKFRTAKTETDSPYHSAGLGLAFCKLAVEAHGGVIGVDSVQPRGSVFWFELPA